MSYTNNTETYIAYFDRVEFKKITQTDKKKGAIVPLKAMRELLESVGFQPETNAKKVYSSRKGKMLDGAEIEFSYYNSTRDADRAPEARLGKSDLILRVETGDLFYVMEKNSQVYFHVEKAISETVELDLNVAEEAAAYLLSESEIYRKAQKTESKLARRIGTSSQFIRDASVVAFIKKASQSKCQMPGCTSKPFNTDAGIRYIEVHHVVPLNEGGDDVVENCMALCPRCHRLLHYGKNRMEARIKAARHMKKVYEEWREKFT